MQNTTISEYIAFFSTKVKSGVFVKMTLTKAIPSSEYKNIYIKPITVKNQAMISFSFRTQTQDITENHSIASATELLKNILEKNTFLLSILFCKDEDIYLKINKKRHASVSKQKPTIGSSEKSTQNPQPNKHTDSEKDYLVYLGVLDYAYKVIPSMSDKYRQINKFIETLDVHLKSISIPKNRKLHVVDMGSGKGYLTFALYDYLQKQLNISTEVVGIDGRQDMVNLCNDVALKCSFKDLKFECKQIDQIDQQNIDILIALHACDTATDDAIYKGITNNAELIVCAPCCHKEIRKQLHIKNELAPLSKHGIFEERVSELVTDGIRTLLMESAGYKTKMFEFVSNEHTRKNVMIIGQKRKGESHTHSILTQIDEIKKAYGITTQRLETLLKQKN